MSDENLATRRKILWIDADVLYLEPYIEFLGRKGFDVVLCGSLFKAEDFLKKQKFDFLILDVMIAPTKDEEDTVYDYVSTGEGRQAGLIFFKRMKSLLEEQKIPLLVLTQRLDSEIRENFLADGLPANAFARKVDLPEVTQVFERIENLLNNEIQKEQA